MDITEQKKVLYKNIHTLMRNLQETDYKTLKFFEGYLTAEEYEPIKAQRQAWRDEINVLQEELEALRSTPATTL